MHIVFLVTTQPGSICGVADYTDRLADAVNAEGSATATIEKLGGWSFGEAAALRRKYSGRGDVIFHLQYPSLGMGGSPAAGLLPFILAPYPVIVTLHEFSIFHPVRKAYFLPTALMARQIIFTNEGERETFLKLYPFARGRASVVPIGENITVVPPTAPLVRPREKIVYFGQIAPGKGIELFLATVKYLRKRDLPFDAAIIGSVIDESSALTQSVRQSAETDGLELHLNYPAADVSLELQKASIALLAFPDGITEKRGSALACMRHGNILITTHSTKTPDWLRKTTYHATSPNDAADLIARIIRQEPIPPLDGDAAADAMASREWPNIGRNHLQLYRRIAA